MKYTYHIQIKVVTFEVCTSYQNPVVFSPKEFITDENPLQKYCILKYLIISLKKIIYYIHILILSCSHAHPNPSKSVAASGPSIVGPCRSKA